MNLYRKQQLIGDALDRRYIRFKWHNVEEAFVEGILSLGDRSLEEVEIRAAVRDLQQDSDNNDLLLTILLGRARTPRPSEVIHGIYGAGAISTRIAREELLAVSGRNLVSSVASCSQV